VYAQSIAFVRQLPERKGGDGFERAVSEIGFDWAGFHISITALVGIGPLPVPFTPLSLPVFITSSTAKKTELLVSLRTAINLLWLEIAASTVSVKCLRCQSSPTEARTPGGRKRADELE